MTDTAWEIVRELAQSDPVLVCADHDSMEFCVFCGEEINRRVGHTEGCIVVRARLAVRTKNLAPLRASSEFRAMWPEYTGTKPIIVWTGECHSGGGDDLLWEPHEFDSMYQARMFMAQDGSRHILTYTDEAVVTERARIIRDGGRTSSRARV